MSAAPNPKFTDGLIFLRPLTPPDAEDHLAGEDDDMAKWLSGGHSTLETVQAFIERNQESWRTGGARRAFGVFDCGTARLIGSAEVNLAAPGLDPGQVNVSYGIFPKWRGRGLVLRAIELIGEYLRTATDARQMVLQIAPANAASLRVAEKAGFVFQGVFEEPEKGPLTRYVRDLSGGCV